MTSGAPDDLGGILQGMQRLQHELEEAQAAATASTVVGTSGGDAVRVHASGEFSFDAIEIDPAVLVDADPTIIEDLVLAAVRDAALKLLDARRVALGGLMSGTLGTMLGAGNTDEPDDAGSSE